MRLEDSSRGICRILEIIRSYHGRVSACLLHTGHALCTAADARLPHTPAQLGNEVGKCLRSQISNLTALSRTTSSRFKISEIELGAVYHAHQPITTYLQDPVERQIISPVDYIMFPPRQLPSCSKMTVLETVLPTDRPTASRFTTQPLTTLQRILRVKEYHTMMVVATQRNVGWPGPSDCKWHEDEGELRSCVSQYCPYSSFAGHPTAWLVLCRKFQQKVPLKTLALTENYPHRKGSGTWGTMPQALPMGRTSCPPQRVVHMGASMGLSGSLTGSDCEESLV